MFSIIAFLIIGGIVGLIARALVPGDDSMGCLGTIVLGVVGSFAGGFLASLFTSHEITQLRTSGLIMSVIGAIVVLLIFNAVTGRKR